MGPYVTAHAEMDRWSHQPFYRGSAVYQCTSDDGGEF